MLGAMKAHGTLTKLKDRPKKYEGLCMTRMENFKKIENVKTMRF